MLYFDFPNDVPTPRQELIAWDVEWEQPLLNPDPGFDFLPVDDAPLHYVPVPAENIKAYTFPPVFSGCCVTSHIVRYWHGQCAASQPWEGIFDEISQGLIDGIANKAPALVSSVDRVYDRFQPNFIGAYADVRRGFVFDAHFVFHTPITAPITALMNPAYRFGIRPMDGFVEVLTVQTGVIVVNDPAPIVDSPKPALVGALSTDLPTDLAAKINEKLTVSLDNPLLDFTCDPNASISQQQQECADQLLDNPQTPTMGDLFAAGLKMAGVNGPAADAIGDIMSEGVTPKNFSCAPTSQPGEFQCAFHPVVERINVLPDELELVFAGEPAFSSANEADKVYLYTWLPTVQQGLNPDSLPAQYCDQPIGRPDGALLLIDHGNATVDL